MIRAVGLSPAWQTIYEIDGLQPGGLLRSSSVRTFPSGKATNAARHAATLAVREGAVTLHTVLGGDIGELFLDRCEYETFAILAAESQTATRCCTSVLAESGEATELIENAAPLRPGERNAILGSIADADADDVIACCGSLPPGTPPDFYARLLSSHSGRSLVDAAGEPLLRAVAAGVTIAKPNRNELSASVGRTLSSDADVIAAARDLQSAGAEAVIVTDGPRPTLLLGPGGGAWITPPEPRAIRSVIGAGDAVAGALADGLAGTESLLTITVFAIAYTAAYLETLPPDPVDFDRFADLISATQTRPID